jgi:hypothetical protein
MVVVEMGQGKDIIEIISSKDKNQNSETFMPPNLISVCIIIYDSLEDLF